MATYIVKNRIKLTRQAGDDFDIVFTVPELFPITNATLKFGIFGKNQRQEVIKTASTGISKNGQTITIACAAADTRDLSGSYTWELEAEVSSKKTTIGMGTIDFTQTLIRND